MITLRCVCQSNDIMCKPTNLLFPTIYVSIKINRSISILSKILIIPQVQHLKIHITLFKVLLLSSELKSKIVLKIIEYSINNRMR